MLQTCVNADVQNEGETETTATTSAEIVDDVLLRPPPLPPHPLVRQVTFGVGFMLPNSSICQQDSIATTVAHNGQFVQRRVKSSGCHWAASSIG
jgi:hypothetical protein